MMSESLYSLYSHREAGFLPDSIYWKGTRDSEYLIKRLTKTRTLDGHSGCVNTISWNTSGSRLISGSDDCHLKIYDTGTGLVWKSVRTGHHSNIFSAKFLPNSDDLKAVSCAGIGSVEYTELTPMGDYIGHPFKCQSSITYQVVTTPYDSNEFFTCEEKGYVRLFDLRVKSSCLCDGCKNDVLYSFPSSVTCMSVHPVSPFYIACGLGQGNVKLLDRRMIGLNRNYTLNPSQAVERTTCKTFRPEVLGNQSHKITSIQFNDVGSELLVSYSEDYVYLYNSGLFGTGSGTHISRPSFLSRLETHSPGLCRRRGERVKRKPVFASVAVETDAADDSTTSGETSNEQCPPSTKKLRLRGDWSDTGPEARPKTQAEEEEGGSNLMNRMSRMFAQWIDMSLTSESEGAPPPVPPRRDRLIDRFRRRRAERERERARQEMRERVEGHVGGANAARESPMMSSTSSSSDSSFNLFDSDTEGGSQERQQYADWAHGTPQPPIDRVLNVSGDMNSNKGDMNSNKGDMNSNKGDMNSNKGDTKPNRSNLDGRITGNRRTLETAGDGEIDGEPKRINTPPESNTTHLDNVKQQSTTELNKQDNQGVLTSQTRSLEPAECCSGMQYDRSNTLSNDTLSSTVPSPVVPAINIIEGETDSDDEQGSLYHGSRDESHDVKGSRGDEVEDGGTESKEEPVEKDVEDCIQPFMVYKGHRNSRTMIKQANFLGDSWVLSGSDCGRMFVWNKWTGEITNLLIADSHVVNCIQPHPQAYLIATSGIDYNIKLWEPVAEHASNLQGMEEVVTRNEAMLEESRNTVTVPSMFVLRILAYLNRRRRMQGDTHAGSVDEDRD